MDDDIVSIVQRRQAEEARVAKEKKKVEKAADQRERQQVFALVEEETPLALKRLQREDYPGAELVQTRLPDGSTTKVAEWRVCHVKEQYRGDNNFDSYAVFVRSDKTFRVYAYHYDGRNKWEGPFTDLVPYISPSGLTAVLGGLKQFGISLHRRQ